MSIPVMILMLLGGLLYLLLAGDLLVRGAVALARRYSIPPMVVGLTIVAFGTSAPELFVSLRAALAGHSGIAIGNVVGSNIANVLLVLGLPALVVPAVCNQRSVRRDASLGLLASLLLFGLCLSGPIGRIAGVGLFALLVLFLLVVARTAGEPGGDASAAREELERVLGLPGGRRMIALFLLLGAIGLPLGADLMVEAAVEIARKLEVSSARIGATIVALGTSMPELATTVVAAMHRHSDVGIGNVLGSNLFNILAIMGITAAVAPPIVTPEGFLWMDLPVMLGAATVLALFAWRGGSIGRGWGGAFLAGYALYVTAVFS